MKSIIGPGEASKENWMRCRLSCRVLGEAQVRRIVCSIEGEETVEWLLDFHNKCWENTEILDSRVLFRVLDFNIYTMIHICCNCNIILLCVLASKSFH